MEFENNEMNVTETCPTVTSKSVEVCVPISVKPFANVGKISTFCCGEPVIRSRKDCEGEQNGECEFTIKQKICIEVPIEFGAKTNSGEVFVNCGESSNSGCKECDEDDDEDDDECDDDDENEDEDEDEDDTEELFMSN